MGEAARRKHRMETITETVVINGEVRRKAGVSWSQFMGQASGGARTLEARPDVIVPCDGCIACCHQRVQVSAEYDGDRLLLYDTETDDQGNMWLRTTSGNACIYLGEEGCTIHDRRPFSCRQYDCRMHGFYRQRFAHESDGKVYAEPLWVFDVNGIEDMILLWAITDVRTEYDGEPTDILGYLAHVNAVLPEKLKMIRDRAARDPGFRHVLQQATDELRPTGA